MGRIAAHRYGFHRGLGWLLAAGGTVAFAGCEIPGPHTLITVTTTADGNDAAPGDGVCEMTSGAGNCSLRAAIDEANATTGNPPRVVVPAGTYVLTDAGVDDTNAGGDLDIDPATDRLLIEGQGSGAVIDADGAEGVLDLRGGLLVAKRIAVTGAATAGVTVRSDTIGELQASAVYGNAGTGVVASAGGVASTINTTLSTNGGGGVAVSGTYIALFTTISANTGGGITGGGDATLRASIVGGQVSGLDCSMSVTSLGHNLDGDSSCGLSHPLDIPGIGPDLEPLSSNPIPFHRPAFLSHVIDEIPPGTDPCGTPGFPTTDQAGSPRPSDSGCDFGAVERVGGGA
jgi:CSLREA domain-containing protein